MNGTEDVGDSVNVQLDSCENGESSATTTGATTHPPRNADVPKPKRLACMICRKRKLRCDGNRPRCSTCTRLGHDCAYDEVRRKSGPKRGYVKALEERLSAKLSLPPDLVRWYESGMLILRDLQNKSRHSSKPRSLLPLPRWARTNHHPSPSAPMQILTTMRRRRRRRSRRWSISMSPTPSPRAKVTWIVGILLVTTPHNLLPRRTASTSVPFLCQTTLLGK